MFPVAPAMKGLEFARADADAFRDVPTGRSLEADVPRPMTIGGMHVGHQTPAVAALCAAGVPEQIGARQNLVHVALQVLRTVLPSVDPRKRGLGSNRLARIG